MEDVIPRQRPENKLPSASSHVSRLQKDFKEHRTPAVIGQTKPIACVGAMRQPITALHKSQESQETSMTRPSQLGQSGNSANQNGSLSHMTRVSSGQISRQRSGIKSVDTMESEIQMELENLADLMDDDFPMDDDFDDSSMFHPTIPKRPKPSKLAVVKSEHKTLTEPEFPLKSLSTLGEQNSRRNSISDNDLHALCKPGAAFGQGIITQSASIVPSRGEDGTSVRQSSGGSITGLGPLGLSFPEFSKLTKPEDILSHIRSVVSNAQMTSIGRLLIVREFHFSFLL